MLDREEEASSTEVLVRMFRIGCALMVAKMLFEGRAVWRVGELLRSA
jgi:hypothetical protein